MKKSLLGIVGLVLVAVIYYFTAGSEQLTQEMKTRVNTELTMLQERGFAIQNREVKQNEEYFVIAFDDPKKMLTFFKEQGSKITIEEAEALKGFKIGVDLKYLNDTYSALSVDMYPLNLPPAISSADDLTQEDKEIIKQLDAMLGKKALLVHVDFNKLLTSFKGYAKDFHETFKLDIDTKIDFVGLTFEGTIKDDRVSTVAQKVKSVAIKSGDDFTISLEELSSDYTLTGDTIYDSTYNYSVKKISANGKDESNTYALNISDIKGNNLTEVKNSLASNKMSFSVGNIEVLDNSEIVKLIDSTFSFNIARLDINVLKSLEKVNVEDEAEVNKLMQALISKGITMEIPVFEVKKLEYLGEKMDGFSMTSTFEVKKTANISAIQANPFTALDAINTKTTITLSDAIYSLIAKQPKAMMLVMLVQPKVVDGKKVYVLEVKSGKILINGKAMM